MKTHTATAVAPPTPPDDPTIWEVDDPLWAIVQPLLVITKPRKKPGRPRCDDRAIFNGLIWLARNGGQWKTLPRRFGAKSTVHDRFREWIAHDCLAAAWAHLLAVYDDEVGLDWHWQAADGCIVKAPLGKKGGPARRRRRERTRPTGASAAASDTC
jgi:putative transposase